MGCINVDILRLATQPTVGISSNGNITNIVLTSAHPLLDVSLAHSGDVPNILLNNAAQQPNFTFGMVCSLANDTLSLSTSNLSFTNNVGLIKSISVLASSEWSVRILDKNPLFSLSTNGGLGGDVEQLFIVMTQANTSSDDIEQKIEFICGGIRKVVTQTFEASIETYVRLTHIETTGSQYINLGYIVKDDDVIEANYVLTKIDATDKFLFGTSDGTTGLWFEYYSGNAYARFGHNISYSSSNRSGEYNVVLQKNNIVLGDTSASLDYTSMPNTPLFLFAGVSTSGTPYSYGYYRCSLFRISNSNGVVMELLPHRRDSDGAVGLLDTVNGQFYVSQGEAFVGGGVLAEGYEPIEYVTFNGDKIYETGYYGNNQTSIDVLFKRTDTSGAHYLFGCSSGNRLTGYLTTSGYWRYGNAYPTFNTNNKNLTKAIVTPGKTTVDTTTRTFNVNEFTTPFTIPVGGVKPSTGVATPQFKGYLYYFIMRIADEIVVDWIPCKRLSDGVEGFWDCVTQTFIEPVE